MSTNCRFLVDLKRSKLIRFLQNPNVEPTLANCAWRAEVLSCLTCKTFV